MHSSSSYRAETKLCLVAAAEVEAVAAAEHPEVEAWAGLVAAHRAAAEVVSPRRDIRKIWLDPPAAERELRDRAAADHKAT